MQVVKAKSGNYKELQVWQKGFGFAVEVYKATNDFPKYETYGLSSQLRRSATSVPSNIAEGYGRRESMKDYLRFVLISYGSLLEAETQILLAKELGYINNDSLEDLLNRTSELGRMLNGLKKSLKNRIAS